MVNTSMNDVYLSVIIPCFNEAKRLGPTLQRIVSYLGRKSYPWEVVVVDDGSKDETVEVARQGLAQFPHQIFRQGTNQGKGAAVKRGMLEAKGKLLLFTDADLSIPIEQAELLISRLESGFDVAIASRNLPNSRAEVKQSAFRATMGKLFNRIARVTSFKKIRDSQCGCKGFRREAARDLFEAQRLKSFSFDAEILYLAQKRGYRITEVPVTWRDYPGSRVHILKDSLRTLWDLIRIPWIHHNSNRQVSASTPGRDKDYKANSQ